MGSAAAAIRSAARQSLASLRRSPISVSSRSKFSNNEGSSLSKASPFSDWHRLSSSGQRNSLINFHYESCQATQAVRFSSAATVSAKDSTSDSSLEESCVSGDEKVEPVIEAKEQPAPPREPSEEEAPKRRDVSQKREEKEALLKSISELEALISEKQSQLLELKERAATTKAELESVRSRVQREADNTKKYAIQDFAKALLEFADNLGRASATVPANVRKELATDKSETGKQLKTIVEKLVVIEKELMKVLKKFGVQKFEPVGQSFDPNSHLALFEIPDPSKEAGTVAMVAKVGYMLHDRVLRPAEVGVVKSPE